MHSRLKGMDFCRRQHRVTGARSLESRSLRRSTARLCKPLQSTGGGNGGRFGPTSRIGQGGDDDDDDGTSSSRGFSHGGVVLALAMASALAWTAPSAWARNSRPDSDDGRRRVHAGWRQPGFATGNATQPNNDSDDAAPLDQDDISLPTDKSSSATPLSDDVSRLKRLQRELFAGMVDAKRRLDELEAVEDADEEDLFIPNEGAGGRVFSL